eukprot:SM000023S07646  [mRNA]  locus=s23:625542:627848:- [translate_table: standard]
MTRGRAPASAGDGPEASGDAASSGGSATTEGPGESSTSGGSPPAIDLKQVAKLVKGLPSRAVKSKEPPEVKDSRRLAALASIDQGMHGPYKGPSWACMHLAYLNAMQMIKKEDPKKAARIVANRKVSKLKKCCKENDSKVQNIQRQLSAAEKKAQEQEGIFKTQEVQLKQKEKEAATKDRVIQMLKANLLRAREEENRDPQQACSSSLKKTDRKSARHSTLHAPVAMRPLPSPEFLPFDATTPRILQPLQMHNVSAASILTEGMEKIVHVDKNSLQGQMELDIDHCTGIIAETCDVAAAVNTPMDTPVKISSPPTLPLFPTLSPPPSPLWMPGQRDQDLAGLMQGVIVSANSGTQHQADFDNA